MIRPYMLNLLLLYPPQPIYSMENNAGFFHGVSHMFNKLYNHTLYFPFCKAVELAEKNHFSPQDCEIIKNYIIQGADPNWKIGEDEETLLRLVVRNQKKDLFDFLLQHNADINAGDKNMRTPLHLLAFTDNEKNQIQVKDLLQHKANIQALDNTAATPLHNTVSWGSNVHAIKPLIKYGADINQKNNKGCTPLARALCGNKILIEVIKELCGAGASLIKNNKENDTAFHIVIAVRGNDSIHYIKPLITHARFDDFEKGSKKTVPFALWILKYWELNNIMPLPRDIKLHILSNLPLSDLYPHKKLCTELLQKNYDYILLPQVHERVENIKQILASPNNKNKTALQLMLEKFANKQDAINRLTPLLDGTSVQKDYDDFIEYFPAIINSELKEDKENLARQMFDNCAKLLLE